MSRKLMNLALMYTAITAYASEYPFGHPSPRIYMGRGTQIPVAVTFLKEALRSSSEKNCLGKMSLSNLKENK